ncbi:hypothetical protein CEJ86_05415 [Sinorhizobium meliloti]|uniref:Uncharacterized protein n=1 Tax=Rhizobium meliloti TaxID=382 RepID=A0A2J0Z6U0_RHIML|nr:hypothetical protein CEJ86_05415 [Sinorhizobium meliloti]
MAVALISTALSASHKTRGAAGFGGQQSLLIPISVLVTEIQPRRVCGAGEPIQPNYSVWLDSRDKHRNEEVNISRRGYPISTGLRQPRRNRW